MRPRHLQPLQRQHGQQQGDIIYPTIIGICSQIGSSSPISIATSSSGNYNNACILETSPPVGTETGSGFTNSELTFDIDSGNLNQVANNQGIVGLIVLPKGYLRWVGGGSPTFLWSLIVGTTSLSNSNTAAIVGTASTSQDATGNTGTGEHLLISFTVAGKSISTPAAGDSVEFKVRASGTLSGVTTPAASCNITVNFF